MFKMNVKTSLLWMSAVISMAVAGNKKTSFSYLNMTNRKLY